MKLFVTHYTNHVITACEKAKYNDGIRRASDVHFYAERGMITISEAMKTLAEIHREAEEKSHEKI